MMYAKYTVVLKSIMDNLETKAQLNKALSTYPVYQSKNDPNYTIIPSRDEINQKLLDHYKYREIGFESIGRFLDELRIAMNEIMPYYNQLFASEDIINGLEDIFGNLDVVETYEEQTSGSSEVNSEATGTTAGTSKSTNTTSSNDSSSATNTSNVYNKTVDSETPQGQLDVSAQNIDSVQYADKLSLNKNETTGSTTTLGNSEVSSETDNEDSRTDTSEARNTAESSGTTSHTLTRKGNQGVNTYAHDMEEFRRLFLNVVQKIVEDDRIKELFMQVY